MIVKISSEYTSVACNRTTEIVDWNNDGLICFGASNVLILYDTTKICGNRLKVLSHHRSQVNSVKWLRKPDGTYSELLSCSADKTAAIWTLKEGVFHVSSRLEGHSDGITSIGGLYLSEGGLVVYTASIDCTVKIWERRDGILFLRQTINLNSGICLTLHAHLLPQVAKPVLLLALDDHKVHIFAETTTTDESGDNAEYHRLHTLAGHEDWVRGIDVMDVDATTILIATASQDTYIRLWRISVANLNAAPTPELTVERRQFTAHGRAWQVELEAVLAGHEGWVYGVQFVDRFLSDKKKQNKSYRLLSSSLDKTLIIWEPDNTQENPVASPRGEENPVASQGVWVERVRVGEVGGNGLGFYGSRFGPGGVQFLGHGYNGSFHIWKFNKDTSQWSPTVVCGGHYNSVEDVAWEPLRGRYLMSVSTDQTTRVHAPWKRSDAPILEWHEVARPQVHGYDMASLALVSGTTFASAAEEKVIRVFSAPHNFIHNFENITGVQLEEAKNDGGPEGASVPSLGLSNKAVFTGDSDEGIGDENDGYFVPINLTEPPTEETLMQNTLWPEVQKLYGHGYEVFCLAASLDGALLASACKATTAEHASVLLWETKNWEQIQKLTSHQLTVTQLAFSPDSLKLVSVSRDRRWTLYERSDGLLYKMAAATDKSNGVHSRIIWCCAWAHDGIVFATGSRDGKVCVWTKTETDSQTSLHNYGLYNKPLELANTSVTAVAFAPILLETSRIIATGFETGNVRLYSFSVDRLWSLLYELDNSAAHHLTVKRLQFKPQSGDEKDQSMLLASCGSDHLVRIYNVNVA